MDIAPRRGKHKAPRLSTLELVKEIHKRSGLDTDGIKLVISQLCDVTKESLAMGFEVPLGDLGCFTFREVKPKKNFVVRNPKTKEELPPKDYPGYFVPRLRVAKKIKDLVKEQTKYE